MNDNNEDATKRDAMRLKHGHQEQGISTSISGTTKRLTLQLRGEVAELRTNNVSKFATDVGDITGYGSARPRRRGWRTASRHCKQDVVGPTRPAERKPPVVVYVRDNQICADGIFVQPALAPTRCGVARYQKDFIGMRPTGQAWDVSVVGGIIFLTFAHK